MKEEEIIFREAKDSDKEEILDLFRLSYVDSKAIERDPYFWEWQNNNNPDGRAFVGIAEINDIIVGHYAVIPLIYQTKDGKEIKVGLVTGVMTHPQYQRRGLFVALSRYTLPEAVKKLNITFTIGYPFTATTYHSVIPGHQKVGWQLCDKLIFYMLPIKLDKIFSYKFPSLRLLSKLVGKPSYALFSIWKKLKSRKLKMLKKTIEEKQYRISIDKIPKFNKSDIELFQKYSGGKFIKKRDIDFLQWRFCQKPNFNYEVIRMIGPSDETIAFEIVSIYNLNGLKIGVIVDIIGEKEYFMGLMNYGNNHLKKCGCEAIVLLDYKRSDLSKVRKSFAFINSMDYFQIINWKDNKTQFMFPKFPRLNFLDFDIF